MKEPIPITPQEEASKYFELIYKDDKYGLKINTNSYEKKIKIRLTPIKDNYLEFKNEYSMEELININTNFKNFNSLNELTDTFEDLIKNKKVLIENIQNDPTNINLGILFYNFIGKETKVLLNLKLNFGKEDYNKYLLRKISNLEKIISQKDKEIKNIKFEFNKLEGRIKEIENIIKSGKKIENNEYNKNINIYNNIYNENNFTSLIQSDILNDKSSFELIYNRLNQINPNNNKNIKFNLIFKADENNSYVSDFHKNCDEKKNVLVLIKTDKDIRFGGFTSEGFDSESGRKKDDKAFIFSLDKKKIFDIKKGKKAISCSPYYGPCFVGAGNGSGAYNISIEGDIFENQQHTGEKNDNSYKINYNYELNNGEKLFNVKYLEVFQIIF